MSVDVDSAKQDPSGEKTRRPEEIEQNPSFVFTGVGNPAVHASCFGIRLIDTQLLARVALAIMIGHKPTTGRLVGVRKRNTARGKNLCWFGSAETVNAYKTTVQVGHLDVACGRIKLEGWGGITGLRRA
jgi:hypothetical protein